MADTQTVTPKKVSVRKRLPKAMRRSEILTAAEAVFSIRGYEAATISEVAGRAGTAEGNVYRYFETKRDLLAQVIANWYETKIAELYQEVQHIPDVRDRMRFLIRYHIAALKDNPGLLGLIIREVRTHNDSYEQLIGSLNRRYTGFLNQVVRDGIEEGIFRDTIPVSLARDMVFGCIEHHTWRYLAKGDTSEMDPDAMTEKMLMMFLTGLDQDHAVKAKREALKSLASNIVAIADDL